MYYLIDMQEGKNKDGKIFFSIWVLDLENHCISRLFVTEEQYNEIYSSLNDEKFPNITDNIALRYDSQNACYKLFYKG